MESRKYKHDRYLKKLEKHKEDSLSAVKYSSDRFDILIISISTTSLILSVTFIRELSINTNQINLNLIKLACLTFGISIISNLLSQVSGYITNLYEIKICTNLIREERGKKSKGNQKLNNKVSDIFDTTTIIFNIVSLISLILGIIFIIIFLFNNF